MSSDDAPLRVLNTSNGVALIGEIDAHTSTLARDALLVDTTGNLTADLSGVSFVDSGGLKVLLESHRRLAGDHRRLVLLDPSRQVRRLIGIAGLSSHFFVEPPLESEP